MAFVRHVPDMAAALLRAAEWDRVARAADREWESAPPDSVLEERALAAGERADAKCGALLASLPDVVQDAARAAVFCAGRDEIDFADAYGW